MKNILLILSIPLLLGACRSDKPREKKASTERVVAEDPHTQSNAASMHPEHLELDIAVNFETRRIEGSATWTLRPDSGLKVAIFDTYNLSIDSILYADGSPAPFSLGKKDSILGSALSIELRPGTGQLQIFYKTGPDATALQWLEPEQTFSKTAPFLYTQSESIYARTWIPCPDGPGIRFTYEAEVTVPEGLMALMSAENPRRVAADGRYRFKMEQPIPAYLMALAVGELKFRSIDPRTGVYAEPGLLDKAYREFEDVDDMVKAAEALYGPYRWGRYDILVLPSGFPLGGMENPRLTFCTPTILAGDKSLVNLIAHELAHSWSGNLVTNASWSDFWLNEGFTVYFERRIMEALEGKAYADMLWELGFQDLKATVSRMGTGNPDTRLRLQLSGRDPDIGLTDIAYEKGAAFLQLLEYAVGRESWDHFLRNYFEDHAFQTMTTQGFLGYLDSNLIHGDVNLNAFLSISTWVYGPGIPANARRPEVERFRKVEQELAGFLDTAGADALDTEAWSTYEWLHFIRQLPDSIAPATLAELDARFHLSTSGNSEIAAAWYLQAIRAGYDPAFGPMREFLVHTGRAKFLEPLYAALTATPSGKTAALDIYAEAKQNYHPLARKTIERILELNTSTP